MLKKSFNKLKRKLGNSLFIGESCINNIYNIVNDNSLDWLKLRSVNDLSPFTFSQEEAIAKQNEMAETLKQNGLLIIKDYLPGNIAFNYANAVRSAIQTALAKVHHDTENFEDANIYIQNSTDKLKTYRDLSSYSKTVLVNRKGRDTGMIDVFNFDKAFKEESGELRKFLSSDFILSALTEVHNQKISPSNLNIYYNKSVLQTRPFHVDSYSGRQYKAFLYLTDVNSLADGPYCYVVKSHTDENSAKTNKLFSMLKSDVQTDAYIYEFKNTYPILGNKGTLVISDQSGIHRGHPQLEGHERIVAVMNYKF